MFGDLNAEDDLSYFLNLLKTLYNIIVSGGYLL